MKNKHYIRICTILGIIGIVSGISCADWEAVVWALAYLVQTVLHLRTEYIKGGTYE